MIIQVQLLPQTCLHFRPYFLFPISDLPFRLKKSRSDQTFRRERGNGDETRLNGEKEEDCRWRRRGKQTREKWLLFGSFNPIFDPDPNHSRRSRRLRSRVAESSTTAEDCFFEKDGRGSALGDGDTANADPAYTSVFKTRICFVTISGSGPNLWVPQTTKSSPSIFKASLLIFESSDSPLLRIVTFPITNPLLFAIFESSELDRLEIDGSDAAWLGTPTRFFWSCLSGRGAGFREGLGFVT